MVRLICDDHLGKLARLLRTLGFDTEWCRSGRDAEIVEAVARGRVFVTRDTAWIEKTLPGRKLVISESDSYAQLRSTIRELSLTVDRDLLFKRCRECNGVTRAVPKDTISHRLPPYIRKTRERIRHCPGCDRLYWEGTHVDAMAERLLREGIL